MRAVIAICLLGILGINSEPVGVCPDTMDPTTVDFLVDSDDCTKFYKCNWGSPVLYDCPDGLHFNPSLNVCDWPDVAGCGNGNGGGNGGGTTTTTKPTTTEKPTTPGSSTTNGGGNGGNACDSVDCPNKAYGPDEWPVFHSHPEDCGKYCVCDNWARVHEMDCPAGLHWNPTLDTCDWPQSAGCGNDGGSSSTKPPVTEPTTTDGTPNPTDEPTTESTTEKPTTTSAPPAGGNACESVDCPNKAYGPDEWPVFHSHPEDCGKYCVCDNWARVHEMDCPAGLHWNPTLDTCDWPQSAGCGNGGGSSSTKPPVTEPTTTDGTTNPTDEPTTESTTEKPTTTSAPPAGGNACESVDCPNKAYGPDEWPVFHSHPEDCGKYCVCDNWARVHEMDCPAGLHWNPTLDTCDWPQSAGCGNDGGSSSTKPPVTEPTTTDGTTNPTDEPTTESTTEKPTTTSAPPAGGNACESVDCPNKAYGPDEWPVFHSHPEDCGKYCVCDNWARVHEMDCPAGLHWNPTLDTCDWPQSAGCGNDGGSSSTKPPVTEPTTTDGTTNPTDEPTTESTTEKPTTTSAPPAGGNACESVDCPNKAYGPDEWPVFHSHPEDCGKYCVCDNWARVHEMDCPAGLHWNPTLDTCDWPQSAGCGNDGGSSSTKPPVTEPTTTDGTPNPTDEPTTESTTEKPTTTSAPPAGGNACESVDCPNKAYGPDEWPVFHSHPEDCGKYCVCDNWARVHEMDCPAGLHWNPTLDTCDWPQSAGCGNDGGSSSTKPPVTEPTTTDGTTNPTDEPTTESTTEKPTTTSAPPAGGNACESVDCPNKAYGPDEWPVFHSHPEDCGKYCVCDNWARVHEMDCPAGLHWNPTLDTCDWPQSAGCGNDGGSSSTKPPVTEPTTTDGTPNPTDEPTTESTTEKPTTTSAPPAGGNACESVDCPNKAYGPDEWPVFHSHPEDCGKYCVCDNWARVHEMDCPAGLQWNPTLDTCDWPQSAGCGNGGGSSSSKPPVTEPTTTAPTDETTTESTTEEPTTTSAPPAGGNDCESVDCPNKAYEPSEWPVFHSHPKVCDRYCKCDQYGRVHDMPCPDGLHFNPKLNVCDWPVDAGCLNA